jgi:hypothetical protein
VPRPAEGLSKLRFRHGTVLARLERP